MSEAEASSTVFVGSPTRQADIHRRPHAPPAEPLDLNASAQKHAKKPPPEDVDLSFWTLVERHKFLVVAMAILVVLCTVYLYFAITMGDGGGCSGLRGDELKECQLRQLQERVRRHGDEDGVEREHRKLLEVAAPVMKRAVQETWLDAKGTFLRGQRASSSGQS